MLRLLEAIQIFELPHREVREVWGGRTSAHQNTENREEQA